MLQEIYVSLIEKTYRIINDFVIEHGEVCKSFQVDMDQLQLFAEEAIEENDYEPAKRFLLQVQFKVNVMEVELLYMDNSIDSIWIAENENI